MLSPYGWLKTAARHAIADGKVAKRRIIIMFAVQAQVFLIFAYNRV